MAQVKTFFPQSLVDFNQELLNSRPSTFEKVIFVENPKYILDPQIIEHILMEIEQSLFVDYFPRELGKVKVMMKTVLWMMMMIYPQSISITRPNLLNYFSKPLLKNPLIAMKKTFPFEKKIYSDIIGGL